MHTYNCIHQNGSPLPASEHTFMLFSTHLAHSLRPQLPIYVFTYSISTGASLTPRRGLEDANPPAGHQASARVPARPPPPYYPLPSTSIPLTPQPPLPRSPNNLGGSLLWISAKRGAARAALARPRGHQVSIQASKTDTFRQGALVSLSVSGNDTLPYRRP